MATLDITPNFQDQQGVSVTLTHVSTIVTLDDLTFRIDYKTNRHDDTWYLDLYDATGTPLVRGVGLACGVDLLYPYRYLAVPPGVLFCSPQNAGGYVDPSLGSFVAGTHSIYYVEAEDA